MGIESALGGAAAPLGEIGGNFSGFLSGLGIFLLIGGIAGFVAYMVSKKGQFKKKIFIFEEVNGHTQNVGDDVATEVVLPGTSIRAFFLKKRKLFLPRPSIRMGQSTYWYFIRDDGEWMNVGLENINKSLKTMDLNYDHSDMRLANSSLKKLIEKNYKRNNWVKEYMPLIVSGLVLFLVGIAIWLIFREFSNVTGPLGTVATQLAEVAEQNARLLASIDGISATGGIAPA